MQCGCRAFQKVVHPLLLLRCDFSPLKRNGAESALHRTACESHRNHTAFLCDSHAAPSVNVPLNAVDTRFSICVCPVRSFPAFFGGFFVHCGALWCVCGAEKCSILYLFVLHCNGVNYAHRITWILDCLCRWNAVKNASHCVWCELALKMIVHSHTYPVNDWPQVIHRR